MQRPIESAQDDELQIWAEEIYRRVPGAEQAARDLIEAGEFQPLCSLVDAELLAENLAASYGLSYDSKQRKATIEATRKDETLTATYEKCFKAERALAKGLTVVLCKLLEQEVTEETDR